MFLREFMLNQEKDDPKLSKVNNVFLLDLIDAEGYPSLDLIFKKCEIHNLYSIESTKFWVSIKGLIQGNYKAIVTIQKI